MSRAIAVAALLGLGSCGAFDADEPPAEPVRVHGAWMDASGLPASPDTVLKLRAQVGEEGWRTYDQREAAFEKLLEACGYRFVPFDGATVTFEWEGRTWRVVEAESNE